MTADSGVSLEVNFTHEHVGVHAAVQTRVPRTELLGISLWNPRINATRTTPSRSKVGAAPTAPLNREKVVVVQTVEFGTVISTNGEESRWTVAGKDASL